MGPRTSKKSYGLDTLKWQKKNMFIYVQLGTQGSKYNYLQWVVKHIQNTWLAIYTLDMETSHNGSSNMSGVELVACIKHGKIFIIFA